MPPKFSRDKNSAEKVALLGDTDSDEDFFLKGPSTASDKVSKEFSYWRNPGKIHNHM